MNEQDSKATTIPPPPKSKAPGWMIWSIVIAALFGFCGCLGIYPFTLFLGLIVTILYVCCGWIVFLGRVVPDMTVDWAGIATALVAAFLCVVCLHYLAGWLYRYRHTTMNFENMAPQWQWRWTFMLSSLVVLLFVAGIAVIGVTHQTGWLLNSPEPLLRMERIGDLRHMNMNNLRQIGSASHHFHDVYKVFPKGATFDKTGRQLHGWQTALLPYVEYENVFKQIDLKHPWNHAVNQPAMKTVIPTYQADFEEATTRAGYAVTHYSANIHIIHGGTPMKITDIKDGLENTMMFGSIASNYPAWGRPMNCRDPAIGFNKSTDGFGYRGKEFTIVGMADASVRTVYDGVSPNVLQAIATPNSGEKIDAPDW